PKLPTTGPSFALFRHYRTLRKRQRGEFFNFTNTPAFNGPVTNIQASNVGYIISARSPRSIQLALKLLCRFSTQRTENLPKTNVPRLPRPCWRAQRRQRIGRGHTGRGHGAADRRGGLGRGLVIAEAVALRDRQRRPSLLVLAIPDLDLCAMRREEID